MTTDKIDVITQSLKSSDYHDNGDQPDQPEGCANLSSIVEKV